MLWFISLILTIMYIIWLTRLINFGVNTATRIAYATERNADNTALLIQALSPEAKGRIADVLEERQRVVENARQDLHRREKNKDTTIRALAIAGLIGLAIYIVFSFAAHADEQQVIRDASGHTIGTATTNSQGTTVALPSPCRWSDRRPISSPGRRARTCNKQSIDRGRATKTIGFFGHAAATHRRSGEARGANYRSHPLYAVSTLQRGSPPKHLGLRNTAIRTASPAGQACRPGGKACQGVKTIAPDGRNHPGIKTAPLFSQHRGGIV